jgi:hypothetical protein
MANTQILAKLYKSVIEEELGLLATIDEDGDVRFKHPDLGGFYLSINEEKDPEYMMLVFPAFFDAKQGVSEEKLMEICNTLNGRCKGVKLHMANTEDKDVNATAEMIVAAPDTLPTKEHLKGIMKRVMSMVASAVKQFVEEVQKAKKLEGI